MSCATTSATLISRSVPLAALMTTDAASSQDCVLVPMRSVTVETRTGPAWPYGWIVSQRQSYRTRAPADKRYVAVSWRQCTAPLLVSVADPPSGRRRSTKTTGSACYANERKSAHPGYAGVTSQNELLC